MRKYSFLLKESITIKSPLNLSKIYCKLEEGKIFKNNQNDLFKIVFLKKKFHLHRILPIYYQNSFTPVVTGYVIENKNGEGSIIEIELNIRDFTYGNLVVFIIFYTALFFSFLYASLIDNSFILFYIIILIGIILYSICLISYNIEAIKIKFFLIAFFESNQ